MTYASAIEAGSSVEISFPKWESASDGATIPKSTLSGSYSCVNEDSSTTLTCSVTTGSSYNDDVLTITNLYSSSKASGDTDNIRIKNFINYPQLRSYSIDIDVKDSSSSSLNTLDGVEMKPTVAATINSASVSRYVETVYKSSVYILVVKLTTILPIGSYIKVTLPSQISTDDADGNDIFTSVSVSSTLNTPTVDESGLSSSPQSFLLTNIVASSSNYRTQGQQFYIQITSLMNPPNTATSSSFTIALYDSSGNMYESKSSGLTVTSTAGVLYGGVSPTLSASSTGVLESVDFTFSLLTSTAITDGSTASLVITFPSEFTLTSGTCTLSSLSNFDPDTCSVSGQVVTVSNFLSDSLSTSEYFSFTIDSPTVTLPSNTATTSNFAIETRSNSYKVDSLSSLTWSSTTAGTLALPTTTSNAVTVDSDLTYSSATYTFWVVPPSDIEQGAVIIVTFPSEITIPSSATWVGIENIATSLTCSVTSVSNYYEVEISGGWSTGAGSFTGSDDLKFSISDIVNPRSTETSGTFTIEVKSSGSTYDIYSTSSPTLTISTASTFSSVSISQALSTNGKLTTYTWTIETNAPLETGDYFKITPPSSIEISSGVTCNGLTGLASSLSCSLNSGNLYVAVAFSRRFLADGDPGTYSFTTSGVTNAPSTKPSGAFTVESMQSDQTYLIEQSSSAIVTNSNPGTITSASVSVDSVELSTEVIYTITFTPVNYVQNMKMRITLPSELSILSGTKTCTNVKGLINSSFNCVYTSSTREIVITGEFTGADNPGEVSFQAPSITNPSSYTTTSSFEIETYHTDSGSDYDIDAVTSGLTVDIMCDDTCLTCSSDASECLSCDASSDYKYLHSNS